APRPAVARWRDHAARVAHGGAAAPDYRGGPRRGAAHSSPGRRTAWGSLGAGAGTAGRRNRAARAGARRPRGFRARAARGLPGRRLQLALSRRSAGHRSENRARLDNHRLARARLATEGMMRTQVYSEELGEGVEVVKQTSRQGETFYGLRIWLKT